VKQVIAGLWIALAAVLVTLTPALSPAGMVAAQQALSGPDYEAWETLAARV
jgi:hypothetical protein